MKSDLTYTFDMTVLSLMLEGLEIFPLPKYLLIFFNENGCPKNDKSMLFVTVGTEQYQFDALMTWIELLIKYQLISEQILVQYGSSKYLPDGARIYRLLPEKEFENLVNQASWIIGHCGEGTALLIEGINKPYVLVPRSQRFDEHVDNHQMELADTLEKRGIAIARSPGDLVKFYKLFQTSKASKVKFDETNLCEYLKDYYHPKKIMLVCSSGGHFKYMQSLKPFWSSCSDRTWVTFRTSTTDSEIEDIERNWAYSPTNRNIPNFIRNVFLAFKIVRRNQPDLIISTGAGVAVPFLMLAKWLSKSKVVFIESKTRVKDISLSAKILSKLGVLDLLIVRSRCIVNSYPQAVYVPVISDSNIDQKKDYKQTSITSFDNVVFICTPRQLDFITARQFQNDFGNLCSVDNSYQKIVIDMSNTKSIDSAGLGALANCREQATINEIELVIWSLNEAVSSFLSTTFLKDAFIIEPASQTFRFLYKNPEIKKHKVSSVNLFLYKTQKFLRRNILLSIFYLLLKFISPSIDINPSIDLHPSVQDPMKRFIDIVGSLVGLSITGILFIPIAIAIITESKGGIFFRQLRCGLLSRPFHIWKFRSMAENAEELQIKVKNQVHRNIQSQDLSTEKFFKNDHDPRVTKVGKFLRKTSLDELPQFWNVLVGEMSLVGTRPPTFSEISAYELEVEYRSEGYTEWNRLDVKPGITGVWQVNGRSSVRTFAEVVNFDLEYRKNWSVWYDIKLIFKTIIVLFDRRNKAV